MTEQERGPSTMTLFGLSAFFVALSIMATILGPAAGMEVPHYLLRIVFAFAGGIYAGIGWAEHRRDRAP